MTETDRHRVCFITPTAYGYFNATAPAGGGAERQLYLLSQELIQYFDVHFIVGDYGQPRRETRDGVTLHRCYVPGGDATTVSKAVSLTAAMKRAAADVYVNRGPPRHAITVSIIARLLGTPWIYNIANDANLTHRVDSLAVPFRIAFENALASAGRRITQTSHQRSVLRERFGHGSVVVPNGYPPLPESDVADHANRGYFLWIGRLNREQKRPHRYLDLAAALPRHEFVLIGSVDRDETYRDEIVARARRLDNVEHIERVPPDEIQTYYDDAIAFINTSAYEGFPNTFLEAWRSATPVLSLTVDPYRYLSPHDVDNGTHRRFGHADDEPAVLQERAERLATDRSLRRAIGTDSREQFSRRYGIESVAAEYADAIRTTLDDSRTTTP